MVTLIKINVEQVSNYLDNLCREYNTCGINRDFITTDGNTVKVNGDDYGSIRMAI